MNDSDEVASWKVVRVLPAQSTALSSAIAEYLNGGTGRDGQASRARVLALIEALVSRSVEQAIRERAPSSDAEPPA
jgi:hypothetical protein